MQILYVNKFNTIIDFKVIFLNLVKLRYKNISIDFINSNLDDDKIILFLSKFKYLLNINILNLPFCINNFHFPFNENTYKFSYNNEICYKCSFFENCRWNHNYVNKIKKIENKNLTIYRNKLLNCITDIYLFLEKLWFSRDHIIIWWNKFAIYYFLFEWYDMFFNWLTNTYFYLSENNRIYVHILDNSLCSIYFSNNGKNIIFKDDKLLAAYLDIMKLHNFDITFYNFNIKNTLLDNIKSAYYFWNKLNFYIDNRFNLNWFFDYKRCQFPNTTINETKKDIFLWLKTNNFSWLNKLTLIAINIFKKDYTILPDEFILVWKDTTPKYIDEIIKSSCLLLERKTDLSHWAIMSREFKKDCIYGIDFIASNVDSYDLLEINFSTLSIKIIKKN